MGKKLDNIFNECLERVRQGESIDECLKRYPKEAIKLEPLLKIASAVHKSATSVQPRPAFKEQTRLNLRGAFLYAQRQARPKTGVSFWGWQRRLAFAVTVILIFLVVGAATTAASTQALPDESLYPLKLATEQVRLALAFSNIDKAKLQARFAERRASEIAKMAHQGKTAYIAKAVERLTNHLEKTERYAASIIPIKPEAKVTPPLPTAVPPQQLTELKRLLEESAPRSLAALERALAQAPEPARPALRHAIEIHKKKYQKILEKMAEKGTPTPPAEPKQKGPPRR